MGGEALNPDVMICFEWDQISNGEPCTLYYLYIFTCIWITDGTKKYWECSVSYCPNFRRSFPTLTPLRQYRTAAVRVCLSTLHTSISSSSLSHLPHFIFVRLTSILPEYRMHCPAQRALWKGFFSQKMNRGVPMSSSCSHLGQIMTSWTCSHIVASD